VVGEPQEGLLVGVGQRAVGAVGDRQEALDALVDRDRHHHIGANALLGHDRPELGPDPVVLEIGVGAEGPSRREHLPGGALAGSDATGRV
jgi:hypothetical protein